MPVAIPSKNYSSNEKEIFRQKKVSRINQKHNFSLNSKSKYPNKVSSFIEVVKAPTKHFENTARPLDDESKVRLKEQLANVVLSSDKIDLQKEVDHAFLNSEIQLGSKFDMTNAKGPSPREHKKKNLSLDLDNISHTSNSSLPSINEHMLQMELIRASI